MYTHYWSYPPSHDRYRGAWPTILEDTRRIIDRVRQAGIVIAGPDGRRRPVLDHRDGIAFNGDASSDLDHETLTLLPPLPPVTQGTPTIAEFCKTARKPYDACVAAVLLRCHLLLPEVFALKSDGGWDTEWLHGATPGPAGRARQPSARAIIADLFGGVPAASRLRPIHD